MLWQILLEHFYGGFSVDLVDDVLLGARHLPLASYGDQAVAESPGSLRLSPEQRVRDPVGDDLVVAILVGWRPHIVKSVPAPPLQSRRNLSLGGFSSRPAKKLWRLWESTLASGARCASDLAG